MMELYLFATSPLYAVISASVTRMGMHLGAGKPSEARLAAKVCGKCVALLTGVNGVIVVSARRHLGRLFSINPQVTDSFSQIGALAAVAYFVLSFFFYAFAVLKAQARSMPIMVGFAFGAWLVGVPMAYMLGVNQSHPSLVGIWHGMICGYAVTSAITFTVAIGWPNWHLEAQKAVARSHIKTKQFSPPQEIAMLLA